MTRRFVAALLTLLIVCGAPAVAAEDVLRWEAVVDAPVKDVWDAFTTKEGIESWMVPKAEVDFRVGGTIRTNYSQDAGPDDPGWITHHILSFEPLRMYSSRFTAPANAPVVKIAEAAWGVVRFEPLGANRTRVILSSCGWGEGAEWDAAKAFFDKGNPYTLERLRKRFPPAEEHSRAADKAFGRIAKLVGGEWVGQSDLPGGGVLRSRSSAEAGPGGKSVLLRGWIGDAEGMFMHGATLIHRDHERGTTCFTSVNENGDVARGDLTAAGEDQLTWEWRVSYAGDKQAEFRVEMTFETDDRYAMAISRRGADGAFAPMVRMAMSRVPEAPPEFRKMREEKPTSEAGKK